MATEKTVMADHDTILSINDARKRYNDVQALDGASLELRRGEWLGLLGPNGAGKTTLVRSIAGRVALDAGQITLDGTDISDAAASSSERRHLGVVPQDIALYPTLTAAENLEAFGRLHGVAPSDIASKVEWALDWTGLADRARHRVETFSGGMKRRLNIAAAVLHEPRVILLDEPTVGVDPQSRQRIWDMLSALRDQGAALLLTTHQLDEAQQMCERIVIIDHGRTIASGSFPELVHATVGPRKKVRFHLHEDPTEAHDLSRFDRVGDRTISRDVEDLTAELPELLEHMASMNLTSYDLQVEAPTLQAVFLNLTGRELRE